MIFNAYSKVYAKYMQRSMYDTYPSLYSDLYRTYIPYSKGAWCPEFWTYVSIDDPRFVFFYEEDEDGVPIETPEHTIAEPYYFHNIDLSTQMNPDEFLILTRAGFLVAIIKITKDKKKIFDELTWTEQRQFLRRSLGPNKYWFDPWVHIDGPDAIKGRKDVPNKLRPFKGLDLVQFFVIE